MNVLLVGTGPVAVAHAQAVVELGGDLDIVGRGSATAQSFLEKTGLTANLGGLEAYLVKQSLKPLTAAIVALPVPDLAKAVEQLVAAGADRILVEKPAGLTSGEVEQLAKRVAVTSTKVFVAFNRRFYQSVATARSLIAEDGGVTSFQFEFTERADQIAKTAKDPRVLQNWFLANSCHVLDLAFHLGGAPARLSGHASGALPWHEAGAIFAGSGQTKQQALFSWHANWTSAGRWGVDLRTSRRRILLQPLETLQIQNRGEMTTSAFEIDDALDKSFKPGFYRQMQAFLSSEPEATPLQPLSSHAHITTSAFMPILSPKS